jgi:hypothetical protein
VVIDRGGDDHSLARRLGVKAAVLREHMSDIDRAALPGVAEAKTQQRAHQAERDKQGPQPEPTPEPSVGARTRYDPLRETHEQVARDPFPERPGRYDALKPATPAPEIAQQFEASADRTAEPVAPIYDRDADNAAWEAQLIEAAIAKTEAAPEPGREEEGPRSPEEGITSSPPVPEVQPDIAPEPEIGGTAEASGLKDPERIATGIFGGVARFVENMLGGLFGFFEPAAPKLSPHQAELAAWAHEEQAVEAATAREAAEREAAFQAALDQIRRDDLQRRQENYSRYGTEIDRPAERGDPEPEQDRD